MVSEKEDLNIEIDFSAQEKTDFNSNNEGETIAGDELDNSLIKNFEDSLESETQQILNAAINKKHEEAQATIVQAASAPEGESHFSSMPPQNASPDIQKTDPQSASKAPETVPHKTKTPHSATKVANTIEDKKSSEKIIISKQKTQKNAPLQNIVEAKQPPQKKTPKNIAIALTAMCLAGGSLFFLQSAIPTYLTTISTLLTEFLPDIFPKSNSIDNFTVKNDNDNNQKILPNKPLEAKKKITPQLAAIATIKPTPLPIIKAHEKSPNRYYFGDIDNALEDGNPIAAVGAFKKKIPAALTAEDKNISTEMEARYYLLIGSPSKTFKLLQAQCASKTESEPSLCIHYLRALVTLKKFDLVKSYIENVKTIEKWQPYKAILDLINLSALALSAPNITNTSHLFNHYLTELPFNAEWYRQRSIWICRAIMSLSGADKEAFVKKFLLRKKELITNAVKNGEISALSSSETLLIPFLNYLTSIYEINSFGSIGSRAYSDNDISKMAKLLETLAEANNNSSSKTNGDLRDFIGKPIFGEAGRLVEAKLALDNGDYAKAWDNLSLEFPNIQKQISFFPYEWTLILARCALKNKDIDSLRIARIELLGYIKLIPETYNDFFHQYTLTQVERGLDIPNKKSLDLAKKNAITPYEKGLIASEEAKSLQLQGNKRGAVQLIQQALKSIPNHGILLQTASEIVPIMGIDPSRYLNDYAQIPEKYLLRIHEGFILSNITIKKLLESL